MTWFWPSPPLHPVSNTFGVTYSACSHYVLNLQTFWPDIFFHTVSEVRVFVTVKTLTCHSKSTGVHYEMNAGWFPFKCFSLVLWNYCCTCLGGSHSYLCRSKTIPCIWNRTHAGHTHVHRDNNALRCFGMWWTAGHLVCFSCNTLYFWNDKQQPVAISALSQHRCHDWANRNRSRLSSALGRHAALDTRRSSTHWVLKVEGYLLCCSGIPLAGFFKNLLHNRLIAVEGCT